MENSVLSQILGELGESNEKTANIGICYLLNKYPAAREALKSVLGMDTIPICYETEQWIKSGGRPDIVGTDADNKNTVFIEGKFGARLTDKQINSYLADLDEKGRLLFLVPAKRTAEIESELEEKIGDKDERWAVRSWSKFLKCVEQNSNQKNDADFANLASDLAQLKAFFEKIEVEEMPPLSEYDLDSIHGKIAMHLSDVIYTCSGKIKGWACEIREKNHKYGTYFEIYSRDFGCDLYVGNDEWFRYKDRTSTPIWLSVYVKDGGPKITDTSIKNALRNFDQKNAYDRLLGIILEVEMDKEEVVDHIVKRVKETLNYLNENVDRRTD